MKINLSIHTRNYGALILLALLGASGCSTDQSNKVVMYCSVDEVFSRPIIAQLRQKTGLDIEPLFDVEAAKTSGLANKIRAESNRPRADIFWNSALLQTLLLSREGLLAPYQSPAAADIPAAFKDPTGLWSGIGLRGRVMISHLPLSPRTLAALPAKPGTFAISNPQFGTTSDWSASYATEWGVPRALTYFTSLKNAGTRVMPGNADVALAVAQGQLQSGITDSDDYLNQKMQGKQIYLVKTTSDNVLVPGTASLIKGAPHAANARRVLDLLLSRATEAKFIKQMPGVFSVRGQQGPKAWESHGSDFSFMRNAPVQDFPKWPAAWEKLRRPLAAALTP